MPKDTDFSQKETRPLSSRELAVLRELATGAGGREIAHTLSISEAAVHLHLGRLLNKIGAQNRAQAAIWAAENNMGETGFGEREQAG